MVEQKNSLSLLAWCRYGLLLSTILIFYRCLLFQFTFFGALKLTSIEAVLLIASFHKWPFIRVTSMFIGLSIGLLVLTTYVGYVWPGAQPAISVR